MGLTILNGGGALANEWNGLGRSHFLQVSRQLEAFHRGQATDVEWGNDPRTDSMARDVIAHVEKLNIANRWRDAREIFDPAHAPLIPLLEQQGQSLPCAAIFRPR